MDQYKKFLSVDRFGSLDGLRAIAILAVLWHHSGLQSGMAAVFDKGQMGVHLFFAISGFLICSLMIREKQRTGDISLLGFYKRRSLRIFPLYYAVLLAYVAVVAVIEKGPDGAEFFANLPYFATYTSNWFVSLGEDGRVIFFFAWSLAAEEQFYLTWPWVEKYVSERYKLIALGCVAAIVAATHYGLLLWLFPSDTLAYKIMWSVAPCILFGVALAHAAHHPKGHAVLRSLLGYRLAAPALLFIVIVTLALTDSVYAAYIGLAALVAACTIREDNGLTWLLQWKPMVRIGVVSYGIYLMHMLTFNVTEMVGGKAGISNPWLLWIAGIVAVYIAAEISFATFERFFLRLKHTKPKAPAAATTAAVS